MMNEGAVAKIAELAEDAVKMTAAGVQYSSRHMHPVVPNDPIPRIEVGSLTGLVKMIEANIDDIDMAKAHVIVAEHDCVELVTARRGLLNRRDTPLMAKWADITPFRFGDWLDQETFIIRVRSLFAHTEDLITVVEYASKVKIRDEATIDDDGVTQTAQVKVGASGAYTETKVAPSVVHLAPFRTFSEIAQPESTFLFRMRKNGDGVAFALFESDGGAWRGQAKTSIGKWLEEKLTSEVSVVY